MQKKHNLEDNFYMFSSLNFRDENMINIDFKNKTSSAEKKHNLEDNFYMFSSLNFRDENMINIDFKKTSSAEKNKTKS